MLTRSLSEKNTVILSSGTHSPLLGVGWGGVLSLLLEDPILPRKVNHLEWAQWGEVQDAEEGL